MLRMIDDGIHRHGLISHDTLSIDADDWVRSGFDHETLRTANNILPLTIDDPDFQNNKAMQINTDIYLRSWISVITETHAFDEPHSLFISEKPWKPVYALHPFMILGHRNTLDAMRSMGYKTFNGLLDESYDSIGFVDRTNIILKNLRRLSVNRNLCSRIPE